MAITSTGGLAAEIKPLYPIHKPKRKPKVSGKPAKPSMGVDAKAGMGMKGREQ